MYRETLAELRQQLGVTQARMAQEMDLPLRTYEDVEAGRTAYRGVHKRAAYMAALSLFACGEVTIDRLPGGLRTFVVSLKDALAGR